MGASTPHFALQLRDRIANLIAGLPPDHPARVEGEREIARLERLGFSGETRGEAGEPGERPLPSLAARRTRSSAAESPPASERPLAAGVEEARAQQFEQERANSARSSASSARFTAGARRAPRGAPPPCGTRSPGAPPGSACASGSRPGARAASPRPCRPHRREPRDQQRDRRGFPPRQAHHRADRADQDQQLGQRQRVPRRPWTLADRQRGPVRAPPRGRRPAGSPIAPSAQAQSELSPATRCCLRARASSAAPRLPAGPQPAGCGAGAGRRLRERPRRPLLRLATASGARPGFAAPHRRRS